MATMATMQRDTHDATAKSSLLRYEDGDSLTSQDLDSSWSKFWIFPVLLATTAVSITLIVALQVGWTLHAAKYDFVVKHRATISILVQVVSGLLGVGQVAVVRTTLNYYSCEKLRKAPLSLAQLNFWSSLTSSAIDWQLPAGMLWVVLSVTAVSLVPAALWAGALTPISATTTVRANRTIQVPRYSNATAHFWKQNWYANQTSLSRTTNGLGTFSYAPQLDQLGRLSTAGASASRPDGTPQLHTKNDNSNFTYYGRSYGAASLVGLSPENLDITDGVVGYTFDEVGYYLDTQCTYNRSSNVQIDMVSSTEDSPITVYHVHGAAPILAPTDIDGGFYMIGLNERDDNIVAISTWSTLTERFPASEARSAYIDILAGSNYEVLNKVQCRMVWSPRQFTVAVDNTQKLIVVTPGREDGIGDMDPSGIVGATTGTTSGDMSMIGTGLFTSVLGDMFKSTIANVMKQPTLESDQTKTLRGIAESLTAIHDDVLVAVSSAQLMVANDTIRTPLVVYLQAGQIGQGVYIYAISGVNFALLVFVGFVAIRSKGWRELPRFNFIDTKSVVIGASAGGTAIMDEVRERGRHGPSGSQYLWTGDSCDTTASDLSVMLVRTEQGLSLSVL